jgi:hypothetical protein
MKRLINFLTLLILITILSTIAIFITSCDGVLVGVPGSGGAGGAGSRNEINLSLITPTPPINPVSQANNVNSGDTSELANGLLDPLSNSLFIVGNDRPTSSNANPNPNVYLFEFIPPNTFNGPLTIDFTSVTNIQRGNLYIDQDNSGNIYVMGSHIKMTTNSDIFIAKINKNTLSFVSTFGNGSPRQGIVLLDKGNSETPGGLLVDGTNLYVAGYNDQGNVIIFKLNDNGSPVNGFGIGGYATIEIDDSNNPNTRERATDISTDGTNLIIVGEQQDIFFTTKLMLFKVNRNNGAFITNSLIIIDPPSGDSFEAAPLDAVILNNKVYLGATLQQSKKSVLAVFDLNNNNASYFTFKDNNNNDIRIFINDVYSQGTNNIIYLIGQDINGNAAFIKFDTSNNTGSYLSANSTAGSWWGNVFHNNYLYIFGRLNSSSSSFTVLSIQIP